MVEAGTASNVGLNNRLGTDGSHFWFHPRVVADPDCERERGSRVQFGVFVLRLSKRHLLKICGIQSQVFRLIGAVFPTLVVDRLYL